MLDLKEVKDTAKTMNVSISEYTYCHWSTYHYDDPIGNNSYTIEQFLEDVKNRNSDEETVKDVYHNTSRIDYTTKNEKELKNLNNLIDNTALK